MRLGRATAVDPAAIHAQAVDVFAPCALGAVINDDSLPNLRTALVCGLANNQLAEPRHGESLRAAGITYVPDYVANGGGITAAGAVIYSNPTDAEIRPRVEAIGGTVTEILRSAEADGRPTSDVADDIALARVTDARRLETEHAQP